mmetsp:Transcript_28946/g.25568  ORF Transcript_28946/g.25568 Transcript_28946/m.25568 type:complete len:230 (-) Transcript_28946:147-836(-)|eukprot:CAMPEP_0201596894 /NCGR_PEP_ID=MMETSP0190_2-20130828/193486_1 /ASSEMBLY_ACC=CAM_ASM_000263 /TAXON_ID=37353 /ORGANISM="Rosalina sp." /LENGTH=229 /DNA_ID=CAMNT_0048057519 /DNA_START=13 /DNA_END=702 /DNA_ORIENTATION=+
MFLSALVSIFAVIHIANCEGDVVELDEANFEHLTQLTTGATTGDWFIKFYAPWCGHCKRLAPTWEEVATELKGEVNVAKVDVTQNRALGKQYGIKGFPTLLLFRRGKMTKYSGARSKDALISWAKSAEATDELPGPVPVTEKAISGLVKVLEDLIGVLNTKPIPAIILIVGGLLIGIMLGAIMCGGSVEYRDRPVYVQQPKGGAQQSTANGPPPIDNDENKKQEPKKDK